MPATPASILRAAQHHGHLTVDSLRAAMIDRDCEHTSRAHVANLLSGKAAWTAHDLEVAFAHVGTRGLLATMASESGVAVVWPDAADTAHAVEHVVSLSEHMARLGRMALEATSPSGDGGVRVTTSERQSLLTELQAALGRATAIARTLGLVVHERGAA